MEVTEEEAKAKCCPVKDCKCLGTGCLAFISVGTRRIKGAHVSVYRCGLCR